MRRTITGVLAAGLLAAGVPALAGPAEAVTVKRYANCTALTKVYQGGVARKGAKDKRRNGGSARYKPYVNTRLYLANARSDRDKDGIACER